MFRSYSLMGFVWSLWIEEKFLVFRSIQPKGPPNSRGEESCVQFAPHQSHWQTTMVCVPRTQDPSGVACVRYPVVGLSIETDGFLLLVFYVGFCKRIQRGRYLWLSSMTNGCLTLMLSLGILKKNFLNRLLSLHLSSPLCMILYALCDIWVVVIQEWGLGFLQSSLCCVRIHRL